MKSLLVSAGFLALTFAAAKAQMFSSGAVAANGSNIGGIGYVVYAIDFGSSVTVNGINFVHSASKTGDGVNFTLNGNGFDGTGGGTAGDSAAVQTLNATGLYNNSNGQDLTLTLQNLTPGLKYSVQLIFDANNSDHRSQGEQDITSGVPPYPASATVIAGIPGPQFITDVFTPTGTSEILKATFNSGNGAQLSGFVLEAPEPGAWAMMGLGLAALLIFAARRPLSRA